MVEEPKQVTITEQEKQKAYNQKWLAKLSPEDRKKYFRLKVREQRGWKCVDCGEEPLVKMLDSKDKVCLKCLVQRLRKEKETTNEMPKVQTE
jgi:hypothetical protein